MSTILRNLTSCIALVAAMAFSVVGAANAGSITCPVAASAISMTLTTSVTATCGPSGNGTGVTNNGANDAINPLGYTTLDANPPTAAGAFTTLTISPALPSAIGTFSFTIPSAFASSIFLLGFQTSTNVGTPDLNPDYFSFFLPSGVNSGSFAVNAPDATEVTRAVIYATPGPIAGAGLPGLILAGGGLLAWLRRRKGAQTVTA